MERDRERSVRRAEIILSGSPDPFQTLKGIVPTGIFNRAVTMGTLFPERGPGKHSIPKAVLAHNSPQQEGATTLAERRQWNSSHLARGR